jgi:hypothetical protein
LTSEYLAGDWTDVVIGSTFLNDRNSSNTEKGATPVNII